MDYTSYRRYKYYMDASFSMQEIVLVLVCVFEDCLMFPSTKKVCLALARTI